MGLFSREKSIEEMEEEHSILKERRSNLEEKVAIKQLEERLGKGGWKNFSSNGRLSGFSLRNAMNWLKSH
jgi:hypothetical protein